MTSNNPSLDNFIDNDWQILGELTLPIDLDPLGIIDAWLTETLQPLRLQEGFTGKIIHSAQQAVESTGLANARGDFEHFHLLIYSQPVHPEHTNSWGFFRIEKIEKDKADKIPPDHAIEFYLYPEGHKRIIPPGYEE